MLAKIIKLRILTPLFIVTFFSFVCYAIFISPPQNHRKSAITVEPTVEIISTTPANHNVSITAQGVITAQNKEIRLAPQVSGVIVKTHKNFIVGGLIPAGDSIIKIESIDYLIALEQAQAKLALAMASLAIEQGQQRLAKKEFELNGAKFVDDGKNKTLALRTPQLKQAQAQVQLAKSDVEKANIALRRTNLKLPYDVRVLSVNKTTAELVNQQTPVAVLAKANERWLALKFKAKNIDRLTAKTTDKVGSLVQFSLNNQTYQGEVISLLANLVNATKMSGAVIKVNNLTTAESEEVNNSLLIGAHISATIAAGIINDAYAIPRESFINNRSVFVVDKNRLLQSRPAILKWQSKDKVIVDVELEINDKIVTSQVFGIATGSKVKTSMPAKPKGESV